MSDAARNLHIAVGFDGLNAARGLDSLNKKADDTKANITGIGKTAENMGASFETQMSGLDKSFILWEKNAGKFTTSMERKQKRIDNVKDKAALLEQEINGVSGELTNATNKYGENSEAARKLNNQLLDLKIRQADYNRELQNLTRFDWDGFGKLGDKFCSVGKKMSMAVTAPLAGVATMGVKTFVELEDSWAAVQKVTKGTNEELTTLRRQMNELVTHGGVPLPVKEMYGIAQAAGRLGIATENIKGFSETAAMLGTVTNMTAEQAANDLAKFANIMQMPQEKFDQLGASLVGLGNNMATTESDIIALGLRLTGAGANIGLAESEVLGFAAALSSLGIRAEAGGTAFSNVMLSMQNSVFNMDEKLEMFAYVAGKSVHEFTDLFERDAASALVSFTEGLGRLGKDGYNINEILDDMGFSGANVSDVLRRAANSGDTLRNAIELGNTSWEENTALTKAAGKRYGTTAAEIQVFRNRLTLLGEQIGSDLQHQFKGLISIGNRFIGWLSGMSDGSRRVVVTIGMIVAAIGPLLLGIGLGIKLIKNMRDTLGTLAKGVKMVSAAFAADSKIRLFFGNLGKGIKTVGLHIKTMGLQTKALLLQSKAWIVNNTQILGQKIGLVALKIKQGLFIGITKAMTAAQWLFNKAMMANPIGLIVGLVVGLIAAGIALVKNWDKISEWFRDIFGKAAEAVRNAWAGIVGFFSGIWDGIAGFFSGIGNWFLQRFAAASEGVKNAWKGTKGFFSNIGDGIKNTFSNIGGWFRDRFAGASENTQNAWNGITGFFSGVWSGISNVFSRVGNWFKNRFREGREAAEGEFESNRVTTFFRGVWGGITNIFSGVGGWFGAKFREGHEAAEDGFDGNRIITFFTGVWGGIKGVFSGVGGWFKEQFIEGNENAEKAWDTATTFFSGVWSGISNTFSGVGNWFRNRFNNASEDTRNAFDGVATFFSGVYSGITNVFSGVGGWFRDRFREGRLGAEEEFEGGKIAGFFNGVWGGITNIFSTAGGWLTERFREGKEGVEGEFSGIEGFFRGVHGGITNVFSGIGGWFKERFVEGNENAENAWNTAESFFSGVWDGVSNIFSGVGGWFRKQFKEGREAAEDEFEGGHIAGFFNGVWGGITNIFSGVGGWFRSRFKEGREAAEEEFEGGKVSAFFTGVWGGIKGVFGGVGCWFRDTFFEGNENAQNSFDGITTFFNGVWDGISSTFGGIGGWFSDRFSAAADGIRGAFSGIGGFFSDTAGEIGGFFDDVGNFFTGGDSKWWNPFSWGKSDNNDIPMFAMGTNRTPDTFIAGEQGPELITGAAGRKVFTAAETGDIFKTLAQMGGSAKISGDKPSSVSSSIFNDVSHTTQSVASDIGGGRSVITIFTPIQKPQESNRPIQPTPDSGMNRVLNTMGRKNRPRTADSYDMNKYDDSSGGSRTSKQGIDSALAKFEIRIDKLIVGGEGGMQPGKLAALKEELKSLFRNAFGELWEEYWYDLTLKHPNLTEA